MQTVEELFRNVISRICVCLFTKRHESRKIEQAKARMRSENWSFLTAPIAMEPSNIMLTHAFGKNLHFLTESIEEEPGVAASGSLDDSNPIQCLTDEQQLAEVQLLGSSSGNPTTKTSQ
ncbi:unnamed protein product [Thelazia callipaeda]|uniref:Uncharacterized protein n=1 Tax=Thelazia callipaeda TaxID=103827 RepID=A0A0N5D1T5_THECL|nr:unnamed protein product [Thelazia callipaeda]